jgi:hypothetical protein
MNPARVHASEKGFTQCLILAVVLILAAGAVAFWSIAVRLPTI